MCCELTKCRGNNEYERHSSECSFQLCRYPLSKVSVTKGTFGCPWPITNCQIYLHQLSALIWAKENFTAVQYNNMLAHFRWAIPLSHVSNGGREIQLRVYPQGGIFSGDCLRTKGIATISSFAGICLREASPRTTLPPTCASSPPFAGGAGTSSSSPRRTTTSGSGAWAPSSAASVARRSAPAPTTPSACPWPRDVA